MKKLYYGKVNGVSFAKENLAEAVKFLGQFDKNSYDPVIILNRDIENKFDQYAIKVFIGHPTHEGDYKTFDIGWIPKDCNKAICEANMDKLVCTLENFNIMRDEIVGVTIKVEEK